MRQIADTDLLLMMQADDHDAFNELFNRYWESLYRTALARLGDDELPAQDIVQDIFIKIWQRRHSLNIETSVSGYLHSAVRFGVISHYRQLKANEEYLQEAMQRMSILENAIADHTDYYEMERTLEYEVSHMPETLQKIYQLRIDNYSIKDIAAETGLAEQTVKNYISEVSRRLRVVIKEKYPEKYAGYAGLIAALFIYS
jgi:RNA polymerase sigma factor (sigma-70 family)